MPFVSVSGLNKSYIVGTARLHVLRDVSLDVEPGEMLAIVGQSGVGKSTLLHVLGGLDHGDSGLIRIGDTDVTALADGQIVEFRNRHVGFVFQFHHLLPEFDAVENAVAQGDVVVADVREAGEPRDEHHLLRRRRPGAVARDQ